MSSPLGIDSKHRQSTVTNPMIHFSRTYGSVVSIAVLAAMFRSSPTPPEEGTTDDETLLLEGHQGPSSVDERPPFNHMADVATPIQLGMNCFHSITDPLNAPISSNTPRKLRSKSDGDVERPPLLQMRFWRQSVDLPENTSEESAIRGEDSHTMEGRTLEVSRGTQQADGNRATVMGQEGQHDLGQEEELSKPMQKGTQHGPADIGTATQGHPEFPTRKDAMETQHQMERLMVPVMIELRRLKSTKIPPDNSRINARSAPQVLRDRLLPIGRHVMRLLQRETVERRGLLEVEIW